MNPSWFPPIPTWETAHPILVHLPLGMLAAVPVLAVWAMVAGGNRRTVGWAVMVVLLMGTTGAVLAASSGAAGEGVAIAPESGGYAKVLEHHEDLGELARNCFLGVSGAYAVITILALALKDRLKRVIWIVLHLAWMAGFMAAFVVLANAGHEGGRLVHEFGLRAPIGEGSGK